MLFAININLLDTKTNNRNTVLMKKLMSVLIRRIQLSRAKTEVFERGSFINIGIFNIESKKYNIL